jgi:hypothetical protein
MEMSNMEIINFSAELTSSDSERRIIGGQIVPFEKIGSTNVGKVVFEKGSISTFSLKSGPFA